MPRFFSHIAIYWLLTLSLGCAKSITDPADEKSADQDGPSQNVIISYDTDAGFIPVATKETRSKPSQVNPGGGGKDAGEDDDGSRSGPVDDAGPESGIANCSDSHDLKLQGDFITSSGQQHWFRSNPRSVTYTIVPAGEASSVALPELFQIIEVCDQRFLVAETGQGDYFRLDFTSGEQKGSEWWICPQPRRFETPEAARSASEPENFITEFQCHGEAASKLTPLGEER
jgi:hypothetical protein